MTKYNKIITCIEKSNLIKLYLNFQNETLFQVISTNK